MVRREKAPIGAPCWIDLVSSDTERSRAFYSSVFGWTAQEASPEFGGYFMFTKGGVVLAGGMPQHGGSSAPECWTIYLASNDARATIQAATTKGGRVVLDAMDVGDIGTMGVVADPGGAVIGLWQPKAFFGFTVLAEPGAPGWFELLTRNYEASVDFYREVFGWDSHVMSDTENFRYTTFGEGEQMAAGIMDASSFLPEGVPSHWSVYFATDDAEQTLELVAAGGGKIVRPAEDTPYGRLATAMDPTGAQFKIVTPNDAMPARTPPS